MNEYRKNKFKISSILIGLGTLLVCFGGVSNTDYTFYMVISGLFVQVIGFILYFRNVKKLKTIKDSGTLVKKQN